MPRTSETSDFSLPPTFIRAAAKLAREEHRTSRQLCDDMLRVYKAHRKQREPYDEAWAMKLIREVEAEDRIRPKTQEELDKEDAELRRYGVAQAKKLGLKSRDIDRLLERHPKPKRKREGRS
jgi:hypothetical protein